MRKSMLNVSCVLPAAAVFAFLVFFTSCGNSSAENVSSSEFLSIESSSSDLVLPSSGSWFGGSFERDSSEGSASTSSSALPVSSSVRQHRVQSSTSPESSSSVSMRGQPKSSSANVHSVTLDQDGFATVADVYKSLLPEEKAVFIIRHSEREDDVTMETKLTANGVKMAQDLGLTLKSDEEFSYITSGFVRTNETANNVSIGRGEPTLPKLITNYDITGNWFLKVSADSLAKHADALGLKGHSVELMARWAYEGGYPEVFFELEPRAEEFIQGVILKNLPKWKRVSIMVSHDIFVMPLTVFGSQRKVALKYHEDYHWINYIAGLAVIVGTDDVIRYIPVKGTDSGVIDYLAIYKRF